MNSLGKTDFFVGLFSPLGKLAGRAIYFISIVGIALLFTSCSKVQGMRLFISCTCLKLTHKILFYVCAGLVFQVF